MINFPTPSYFLAPGYMTSECFWPPQKKPNTALVGPKFFLLPILFWLHQIFTWWAETQICSIIFFWRGFFNGPALRVVKMRGPASEQASWGVVCLEDDQYVFWNQQNTEISQTQTLNSSKINTHDVHCQVALVVAFFLARFDGQSNCHLADLSSNSLSIFNPSH